MPELDLQAEEPVIWTATSHDRKATVIGVGRPMLLESGGLTFCSALLTPAQARDLAQRLIDNARFCETGE